MSKKQIKQLIGYIILLVVLLGTIIAQVLVFGLVETLKGWGIGILFAAIILFACYLIKDEE